MDQPVVANLLVSLTLLVRTLLKGFGFPVDVYERVYILLAFHGAFLLPAWILLPKVLALHVNLKTNSPSSGLDVTRDSHRL